MEETRSTPNDPPTPHPKPRGPQQTQEPSPSGLCLSRVKRDMMAIFHDPPPGIVAVQDEQDMTIIHALIIGSLDTPYEGGFFYFVLHCPPDYPIKPPKVKFMTTGGGTVSFNPNLYKCGTVCMSILGTWSGPTWSPALTISSVLVSIQSLLNDKPYHNEPGFEDKPFSAESKRYNEIIQHETIRVAVCGMIANDHGLTVPQPLVKVMNHTFLQFFDFYDATVRGNERLNGVKMQDPFGRATGSFEYIRLYEKLHDLHAKIQTLIGPACPGLTRPVEASSSTGSVN